MHYNRRKYLLQKEVEDCVSLLPNELRSYVMEPLKSCGRVFSAEIEKEPPWALLPVIVFESICSSSEKVIPLAASIQFFMAAGDVFDDIEDNDSPLSLCAKYGTAITNNIATTLLVLGERAITRLKDRKVEGKIVVNLLDTINSYYLTACTGQHLDLLYERKLNISEDEYLNVLSLKSASQIECSCYTAALLATDDEKLHDIFKEFGHNLGMMAQITNDISGIITGKDIFKRKITLPIIFALSQTEAGILKRLENYYANNNTGNEYNAEQISMILSDTGAIHYVTIILETYRIKASNALTILEQSGINIGKLKELIK